MRVILTSGPSRIGCKLCLPAKYYNRNVIRRATHVAKCHPPWKILFYGTDDFSCESLRDIHSNWSGGNPRLIEHLEVVTAPLKNVPLEVRQYANKNNLLLHDWPYCPKETEFDLGVVVSFGYLIPKEIIQSFPLGMLNVHASLLPRWRGAAPIFHTLLNGDRETGVTIMQIEPHKFDTGKILAQRTYTVTDVADASVLRRDLAKMGGNLLIESLGNLEELMLNSRLQDESLSTKAPKIKPEMAVICWHEHSCQHINRLYRALADTMRLQTTWCGQEVRLSGLLQPDEILQINLVKLSEEIEKSEGDDTLRPGKVVYHKRRKVLLILCKDGWVGFRFISHKRKPLMSASEFYNGYISKVKAQQSYFE